MTDCVSTTNVVACSVVVGKTLCLPNTLFKPQTGREVKCLLGITQTGEKLYVYQESGLCCTKMMTNVMFNKEIRLPPALRYDQDRKLKCLLMSTNQFKHLVSEILYVYQGRNHL